MHTSAAAETPGVDQLCNPGESYSTSLSPASMWRM
jgi:hypothetical protein